MRRWIGTLIGVLLPMAGAWAGVPTECPPITDPLMGKWCQSTMDHLNTLECLTADPNGSVLGTHGELKCANFDGCQRICMNTSTGPNKGTNWSCFCPAGVCPGGSDGQVQYNNGSTCGGESDLTWDDTSNRLGVGTGGLGDEQIHSALATDGDSVLLLLENSQANSAGSTNETAQMRFGFGGDNDVGRISMEKAASYTGGTANDARMRFLVDVDATVSEHLRMASDGVGIKRTVDPSDELEVFGGVAVLTSASVTDASRVPVGSVWAQGTMSIGDDPDATDALNSGLLIRETNGSTSQFVILDSLEQASGGGIEWQTSSVNSAYLQYLTLEGGAGTFNIARFLQYTEADQSNVGDENPTLVIGDPTVRDKLTITSGDTLPTQRFTFFAYPTVNGVAGGSPETITDATTVYIEGPPSGSDITFTNGPYALWVDDGAVRFDGPLTVASTSTSTVSGNVVIQKADPTVIYDTPNTLDTDFWAGVQDDAGNDNDDTYQIGTGITPGSNTQFTLTNAGALTVGTINTGLGAVELAAGQWTPTANSIANLDSSSAAEGQYARVGATVTGSIQITVDPTLTTTSTQLELDLPVTSNFGATSDAAGTCAAPGIAGQVAAITADTASDELEIRWVSSDTTSQEMDCTFSYQVI